MRISKRGSRYLHLALWQAALYSSWFDPGLKKVHENKIKAGKHHFVAVRAVANKLVHIIYAILRDNKPYVPEADENPSLDA